MLYPKSYPNPYYLARWTSLLGLFDLDWSQAPAAPSQEGSDRVWHLEVPGFKEDQIEVTVDHEHLVISASRDGSTRRAALWVGPIQADAISATLEDGILTVKVPPPKAAARVPVKRAP